MIDLSDIETYDKDETKRKEARERLDSIYLALEYLEKNLKWDVKYIQIRKNTEYTTIVIIVESARYWNKWNHFFHCDSCGQDSLEYKIDYHCGSCNPDGPDYIVNCQKCDYGNTFDFDELIKYIKKLEESQKWIIINVFCVAVLQN